MSTFIIFENQPINQKNPRKISFSENYYENQELKGKIVYVEKNTAYSVQLPNISGHSL